MYWGFNIALVTLFLNFIYESCESVSVMKEEQESTTGTMLDFNWMTQAKSYVQITRSMITVEFVSTVILQRVKNCGKPNDLTKKVFIAKKS